MLSRGVVSEVLLMLPMAHMEKAAAVTASRVFSPEDLGLFSEANAAGDSVHKLQLHCVVQQLVCNDLDYATVELDIALSIEVRCTTPQDDRADIYSYVNCDTPVFII